MNGYAPSARKRLIQYSKPPANVNFVPKTLYSPKIRNRIPTAMRSPARALVLESSVGTAFASGPSIIADQTYTKLAFEGDCSSSCRPLACIYGSRDVGRDSATRASPQKVLCVCVK